MGACSTLNQTVEPFVKMILPYSQPKEKPGHVKGPLWEQATRFYAQGDWDRAMRSFESNALSLGSGRAYLESLYYSAECSMQLGEYVKARDNFRIVHLGARKIDDQLEVMALYRKSYALEELGMDDEALASLLDVYSRKIKLPFEVQVAELPARIAGVYARSGSLKRANKYYEIAENGIKLLKSRIGKEYPPWYAKTLYYMGATSLGSLDPNEFDEQLKPMRSSQKYLLMAVETGGISWSRQAVEQIIQSYKNLLKLINNLPQKNLKDTGLAKKIKVDRQIDMSIKAKTLLDELQSMKLVENELTGVLFSRLEKIETEFDSFIYSRGMETELTDEAKRNRRKVRTIDPNPILEEESEDPNL